MKRTYFPYNIVPAVVSRLVVDARHDVLDLIHGLLDGGPLLGGFGQRSRGKVPAGHGVPLQDPFLRSLGQVVVVGEVVRADEVIHLALSLELPRSQSEGVEPLLPEASSLFGETMERFLRTMERFLRTSLIVAVGAALNNALDIWHAESIEI